MYSIEDIKAITNIIKEKLRDNCQEIILFGSYANNSANEKSDIDLAVLLNVPLAREKKLDVLSQLWWETSLKGYSVDLLIKPKQDFDKQKKLPTLSRVISREGKLLWKKN